MGITVTNLTVLGTAVPWTFGGTTNNPGTANILASYNAKFCDGSAAQLPAPSTINLAYVFGQQHVTPSGETGPTTMSVTPGQVIMLKYSSGTVATQSSGAGNSTPIGSPTTSLVPLPGGGTDANGYTMGANEVRGFVNFNINATVNTSGTAITITSGGNANLQMIGRIVWINNAPFTVATVTSPTTFTTTATAGTHTGVSCFFWGQNTNIGGLVGAFTDGTGQITGTDGMWDWASWGGTSSTGSFIMLTVPPNATTLSMGINDSILRDNTGSFSMVAYTIDAFGWSGDRSPFSHFPFSGSGVDSGYGPDHSTILSAVQFLGSYKLPQVVGSGDAMRVGFTGQLHPHGAQNSGGTPAGVGQNFPY